MKIKTCTKCKIEKNINEFPNTKTCWCRMCHNNYHKKLRKTKKHKKWDKEYRKEYKETISGTARHLLGGLRARAKINNMPTDIDRNWLVERLTPMKCEATGLDLTLRIDKSVNQSAFRPSVDRIDNNKGYTKDNCRIVAVIFNKAKLDCTDADVIKMA